MNKFTRTSSLPQGIDPDIAQVLSGLRADVHDELSSGGGISNIYQSMYGRNLCINPCFRYWLTNAGETLTATTDAWKQSATVYYIIAKGSTITMSQQPSEPGMLFTTSPYFARLSTSAVTNPETCHSALQIRCSDIKNVSGKTVTFILYARGVSGDMRIGVEPIYYIGSGSWIPVTDARFKGEVAQVVSIGTEWKQYTVKMNFPSIVGETLGPAPTWFGFNLWLCTNTTLQCSGNIGQSPRTIDIGAVACYPFAGGFWYADIDPVIDKLILSQFYNTNLTEGYYPGAVTDEAGTVINVFGNSLGNHHFPIVFPCMMNRVPAVATYNYLSGVPGTIYAASAGYSGPANCNPWKMHRAIANMYAYTYSANQAGHVGFYYTADARL